MYDLAFFDRAQLAIALSELADELSEFRYDHKLSNGASLVSVASFCEELWIRKSSSYDSRFYENREIIC